MKQRKEYYNNMQKTIITIDGVKYLVDINDNSIFEIFDYCKVENSPLTIVGIIIQKEEYYYLGKKHIKYHKKWGCISTDGDVIIPFIYDLMKTDFNFIETSIEEDGICFPKIKYFYFDNLGIPIDPNTRIRFYGWEWVEYFDRHSISIGQKNGKQGVIRKDGSIFIEPLYQSIEIDFHSLVIKAKCIDSSIVNFIYRKECKGWKTLPQNHIFSHYTNGLYIIEYNKLKYAMDTSWNMVILPYFDKIDVRTEYCIVSKKGVKGLISRKAMITVDFVKNPIFAMLLKLEYEDIKEKDGGIIIIKNSMQGLYNIKDSCILLNPCIPIDYPIIPYTLSDGAIAYKKGHEYGYLDLFGNLLFTIVIENERINRIRGFKEGKAIVSGNEHLYIFKKDGTFEKLRLNRKWNNTIYHYSEAERWDAMTDGMYGDYPGGYIDYDTMGF